MTTTFTFLSMSRTYFDLWRLTVFSLAVAAALYCVPSRASDPARTWLDRPWNIRYFLHVESNCSFSYSQDLAKRNNAKHVKKGNSVPFFQWESTFSPSATLAIPLEVDGCKSGLSIVVINFDQHGYVLTPNSSGKKLKGRISMINSVVMTANDDPNQVPFKLGNWFWGIPGDGAVFSPGVCTLADKDRYAKGFDADKSPIDGNFGCREWTYQLKDSGSPYIDITSYEKQGEFIKATIGWGRFDIAPKPIIGKDGKNWVCLHECPDGSAQGIIPNIESWAAKYGFPVPQRPERTPMFRDEDYPAEPDD